LAQRRRHRRRKGFDLQLTRYDERGWRATFFTTGMEQLANERDRHRMGAHAVAGDAADGMGGANRDGTMMMLSRLILL
jgi:hypothetical protein